jgi:hypothetical protein
MKILTLLSALVISFNLTAQHDHSATPAQADTLKKSIPKEVHAQIGETHMMIHYHAPAVRGRMIWGGLVPYDEVWVTGAHSATSWEFNRDIVINGTTISAGKYAIFTIPGKERWTFIVNRNWDQHLTDEYNPEEDIIRVELIPQVSPVSKERLFYTINNESDKSGLLSIGWEKATISIPFQIK